MSSQVPRPAYGADRRDDTEAPADGTTSTAHSTATRRKRRADPGPDAIERVCQTIAAGRRLRTQLPQRRAERLPAPQDGSVEVAVPLDPPQRLPHPEVARPHLLAELLPAQ